ncbi:uncharacterized protein PHACADRAFT_249537 [Phanerochaete carnosa HHB-10118-sp]|uniref:BTB domain-containing protein n=1 Tax=Phanerochaete carnosa (strain HHB-10118-sp) TaxID=650164 RepID=K5X8N0_PHACS|nr:uncharacterized protein PHACADRAFT_249537 [Phanerochaete carnosa HHB-10118-sp]EKM59237.1 hypothetical protein PHACADRAFT_249537 [Phanerochaete carnosa HHB-10118-sp]
MAQRSGTLGAGATVVRTPQEALAGPRLAEDAEDREDESDIEALEDDGDDASTYSHSMPNSPPLPPIPDDGESESDSPTPSTTSIPSRPTRPVPPPPVSDVDSVTSISSTPSLRRPALKVLDSFPPVPALPANLPSSPPQPPFEPILLSPPPAGNIDPAKVIVSLETSTTTLKATMKTLMSRPSVLASYLQTLQPPPDSAVEPETPVSRLSEAEGSFSTIFHRHLASSGLLLPNSSFLHIFLDRPSAPYAHILAYLRTPVSTPEHPSILPRAVQLLSSSSSRLEALLELRDEARYLELDELYKLCTDELRSRQSLGHAHALSMHTRVASSTSTSAASVRSLGLGALRELTMEDDDGERQQHQQQQRQHQQQQPARLRKSRRHSGDSGIASGNSASGYSPRGSVVAEVGWHEPVPGLAQRSRSPRKYTSLRAKPVGEWI